MMIIVLPQRSVVKVKLVAVFKVLRAESGMHRGLFCRLLCKLFAH